MKKPILSALIASLALCSLPASAAVYVVNSSFDDIDGNPGDGICLAANPANGCTLRAAVMEANASATLDTIILDFNTTYTLTRTGAGEDQALTGDLDIHQSVVIATPVTLYADSGRPLVAAHPSDRIFDIHNGAQISLIGMDLANGVATNFQSGEHRGGAIQVREGAAQDMTIDAVRFTNNRAFRGAALFVDRGNVVQVIDSEFSANAAQTAQGVQTRGTAIFSEGRLTLERTSVFLNDGPVAVAAVDALPGGFNDLSELILNNSTVADNAGRGIGFGGQTVDHILRLNNTTVVGNAGTGLTVTLSTAGTWTMRNSILAGNGGQGDCSTSYSDLAVVSLNRYNADSDDSCDLAEGSSNYPGIDPLLAPLKRRMGDFTHAYWPLPTSPMIDTAHPLVGGVGCQLLDQGWRARAGNFTGTVTPRCDVGAIELPDDLIFYDPLERFVP